MDGFREHVERIRAASVAEDLFGDLGGDPSRTLSRTEGLAALGAAFRRIAHAVHPDRAPASPGAQDEAHAAFVKASALREAAERAILAGSYGDRRTVPVSAAEPPPVIVTRDRAYRVDGLVRRGDLCELFACTYDDPWRSPARALLKVVASPDDSDLLENEARVLGELFPRSAPEERFLRYLPRLVDAFVLREEASGVGRRVVVLPHFDEHLSLEDVLAAYPDGIDFRDAVWMVKRLLAVLGFVHRRGFVHGAVVPAHVLVHPVNHGARLVDWCYAVPSGERVGALSVAYEDLYAPEIRGKQPVSPQTDIYMAARCMLALLGERPAPPEVRTFFESCLARSPARRPDDAWKLHDELDERMRRLVGPPVYRAFEMPRPRARA